MIIEKVDGNAALINFDQSKAFDRVKHDFLKAVSSVIRGIRFLYAFPSVMEVNGVISKLFTLSRSIHRSFSALALTERFCVGTFPSQIEG